MIKETEIVSPPAELKAAKPLLTRVTNSTAVKSCSVGVTNIGGERATGVAVSFEFEDGTLVPAEGPEEVMPGDTAKFVISADNLPLEVAGKKDPRVITNFQSGAIP